MKRTIPIPNTFIPYRPAPAASGTPRRVQTQPIEPFTPEQLARANELAGDLELVPITPTK